MLECLCEAGASTGKSRGTRGVVTSGVGSGCLPLG